MLVKSGLNYSENYTQHLLLETTKQYTLYIGISTAIMFFIYFAIRYYKKGVLKVLLISILGIVGTIIFCSCNNGNTKNANNKIILPNNAWLLCCKVL